LELSLQYTEESAGVGKVVLGYLTGNEGMVKNAVKLFNQAMANQGFKQSLIAKLKSAQETLSDASRVLTNAGEAKMATEPAAEIGKILEVLSK